MRSWKTRRLCKAILVHYEWILCIRWIFFFTIYDDHEHYRKKLHKEPQRMLYSNWAGLVPSWHYIPANYTVLMVLNTVVQSANRVSYLRSAWVISQPFYLWWFYWETCLLRRIPVFVIHIASGHLYSTVRVMDSALNEVFVGSWLSNYSTSMAWVTLVTTFHSQVSVQLYNKATQQAATKTGKPHLSCR